VVSLLDGDGKRWEGVRAMRGRGYVQSCHGMVLEGGGGGVRCWKGSEVLGGRGRASLGHMRVWLDDT